MNKKGQFYLIAAIIIVIVLVSLNSISTNFILHSKPQTIEEISSDVNRESYKVIEYGLLLQNAFAPNYQCSDGINNDPSQDSLIDCSDPDCINGGVCDPQDNDESGSAGNNYVPPLTPLEDVFAGTDVNNYLANKLSYNPSTNIFFIYGNKNGLTVLQYNRGIQGNISLGGVAWTLVNSNRVKIKRISKGQIGGSMMFNVEFDLEGMGHPVSYPVTLNDNELFYFVIVSQQGEDIYVEKK